MSNSSDLITFLKARLDEDERSATPGRAALDDLRFELKQGDQHDQRLSSRLEDGLDLQTGAWADRIRREVEAKRRIMLEFQTLNIPDAAYPPGSERHTGFSYALSFALKTMATVYSDHPDYPL